MFLVYVNKQYYGCSVHTLFKIKINMMENINVFVLINKKPELATIQNLQISKT